MIMDIFVGLHRRQSTLPYFAACLAIVLTAAGVGETAEPAYGLTSRPPWTGSRLKGSPDPLSPYRTERAFPRLKFAEPVAMAQQPGGSRWFLAERYGRILSFPDVQENAETSLVMTVPRQVLGLALHPDFARNGWMLIAGIIEPANGERRRMRVSRFRVGGTPPLGKPDEEQVILEWPSLYHDGGCLAFGPDGYLYISAGDGGGENNGQGLSELSSSILRIDVDHSGPGRPYSIPRDNPFVGVEGARPEIWAFGLRQPWRFSVDRTTGDVWVGDVGQDLWEMIYLARPGGNYGWNIREGAHPYQPWRKPGPGAIIAPIVEHSHAEARSITGGLVSRGTRLKDLAGKYIYGDYDTGKIWALAHDGSRLLHHSEIADSNLRIVDFSQDHAGEIYLVDHMGGGIHRLVPSPPTQGQSKFPRRLSETGLFISTRELRPAPGLVPYSVNAPLWSDGAAKERYLAVPGDGRIEFDAVFFPDSAAGRGPHGWKFPDGTAIVKTFFLDLDKGNLARRVRLETRVLLHERLVGTEEVGDQFWRGFTYIWDDDQGDATLLEDPKGRDRVYTIQDPDSPGGRRQQTWHFPSRTECMVCHTMPAKFVLGVNTLQMNRDFHYDGIVDNQLRAWEHAGLFTKPLPEPPTKLPKLVDPSDAQQSVELRARSYLHANCSHCHRAFGGGNASFQLLATLSLEETGFVGNPPALGNFDLPRAQVIRPGEPECSVAIHRMSTLGAGRMPPLGSGVVDRDGVRLIQDWVRSLPRQPHPETAPGH